MKLLFKQRFSWLGRYDIFNEDGSVAFHVQGRPSWGHKLEIRDPYGQHIGTLKEEFAWKPRYAMYIHNQLVGYIRKELTFFKPRFTLDCKGWTITGNAMEWEYSVVDAMGNHMMDASKQLFNWLDTYVINVPDPHNALFAVMIVLAIDAAKQSTNAIIATT